MKINEISQLWLRILINGWIIQTAAKDGEAQNRIVTEIHDGDYIVMKGVDFQQGADSFTASLSCGGRGGTMDVRLESERGLLLCTIPVCNTGGWGHWQDFSVPTYRQDGVADLYFVFHSDSDGEDEICRFDWWQYEK